MMKVSYKPLWIQLIKKDMMKTDLCKKYGISGNLVANMGTGKYISLKNIVRICEVLNCRIEDVIEVVEDDKTEE